MKILSVFATTTLLPMLNNNKVPIIELEMDKDIIPHSHTGATMVHVNYYYELANTTLTNDTA